MSLMLVACAPVPDRAPAPQSPELPYFGDGYRFSGDPCRRLGESDITRNWLDDSRDLVACPPGDAAAALAATPGAMDLSISDDTVILSVPR